MRATDQPASLPLSRAGGKARSPPARLGLASICLDSLTRTGDDEGNGRAVTVAEVFIDALLARESSGEAGVTPFLPPASGASVGGSGPQGRGGWRTRGERQFVAPPSPPSAVLPPAGGETIQSRAVVPVTACRSTTSSRDRGVGAITPKTSSPLCWYHHHVAIHGMGMEIDPESPLHRRRLRWPGGPDPPPGKRKSSDLELISESVDQLHQTLRAADLLQT